MNRCVDGLVNALDFTVALKLNCAVDYYQTADILKQAVTNLIKRAEEDTRNKLSKNQEHFNSISPESSQKISEAERKLREAKQQLLEAEKVYSQALEVEDWEEFEGVKRWKAFEEIETGRGSANANANREIFKREVFEVIGTGSTSDYAYDNIEICKRKVEEAKKYFLDCMEEISSRDNELKKPLLKYTELSDKIVNACNLFKTYHYYLLFICVLLNWLLDKKASIHRRKSPSRKLTRQQSEDLGSDYAAQRNEILNLYAFLVLIDERREGRIPAWEGIRIVREKI